ncbi:nitrate reductase molybdenum cofactor assembly chaperone [Pectobacterium brasiliense]|uniref:nitrate reductase molybdenum cofactor assembly chaperone n=1 Tax=Pectobacterium brasiliense TaxID=180957 RepID=UPI001968DD3D|nr:nitrate reductase molybdenum cofactor assembly chaperone [Pectobacterium brasiliense]MBN3265591.1 nitrate reductase molybdenum cofactor assembly chaperone [Pectobacterium brasiliense]
MISLRIIARLLDYPDSELWENRAELIEAVEQADALPLRESHQLMQFINTLCAQDLLDKQAEYSGLFDRGRATSLLLFEHVHGESRDRGQAMVDLMQQYQDAGLALDCRELPDYLPLYLEYLSRLEPAQGRAGLLDIAPILALIGARLQQRDSSYAVLFDLLLALSGSDLKSDDVTHQVADEARDDTPQALDAVWEEEQVKFLGEEGCASAQQTQHQRRFAGAVVPQYLNLDATSARGQR